MTIQPLVHNQHIYNFEERKFYFIMSYKLIKVCEILSHSG